MVDLSDSDVAVWREWTRAVLPMLVLALVSSGVGHGYGLVVSLRTIGLVSVGGGSIYPLLARLEAQWHLVSSLEKVANGKERRVFSITDKGQSELTALGKGWTALHNMVLSVIPRDGEVPA